MYKAIFIPLGIVFCLLIGGWIAWECKAAIAAKFISKHLHVPSRIETLDLTKTAMDISNLWIGTPFRSRTKTSFSAESIEADANFMHVFADPLIIDRIEISNIYVGIEYYENGQTNWSYMLGNTSEEKGPAKGRNYLIRTLVLENLTVEVTQANGQKKRYPTIGRMEFHNLSNETGFPVNEIEKAIFNQMMKNIFDQFNLFKQLPTNSPLKYLPNFFK